MLAVFVSLRPRSDKMRLVPTRRAGAGGLVRGRSAHFAVDELVVMVPQLRLADLLTGLSIVADLGYDLPVDVMRARW